MHLVAPHGQDVDPRNTRLKLLLVIPQREGVDVFAHESDKT